MLLCTVQTQHKYSEGMTVNISAERLDFTACYKSKVKFLKVRQLSDKSSLDPHPHRLTHSSIHLLNNLPLAPCFDLLLLSER